MRDVLLDSLIRTALRARLADYGYGAVAVKKTYQPTQQGAPSGLAILFAKLFDVRHGSPQRLEVWNVDTQQFDYVESIQVETTYQFAAMAERDPADVNALTAGDYLKAAAAAMQSDTMLAALRAQGVGVLRVREIRSTPVTNEKGESAENPTFDVVLTHRDAYTDALPAIVASEVNINRV